MLIRGSKPHPHNRHNRPQLSFVCFVCFVVKKRPQCSCSKPQPRPRNSTHPQWMNLPQPKHKKVCTNQHKPFFDQHLNDSLTAGWHHSPTKKALLNELVTDTSTTVQEFTASSWLLIIRVSLLAGSFDAFSISAPPSCGLSTTPIKRLS